MADQSDESFLQAWEAHEKCPSPVRVEDPWGSIAPQGEPGPGNPNKGLPTTTAAIDEKPSSDIHYVNSVFQSSNRNNSCAIISTSTTTNKNNNSNTGTPNEATRGFEDDFGAWSETDVIFKSGLLDEEFKTVSVTAEEDDLWSSADLSSLSLSAIAEDVGPGGLGDRANSKETFQGHDIITPPEAGKNSHGYGPSDLASMKENRDVTPSHGSSNKSGSCSGNNALVRPMPGRDGLSGSFIDNDGQGVAAKSVPHDENNSTPSNITRHSQTITAAVASEGSISDQIGYGSAGAAVKQSENTSINLTPGIVTSNREAALSADVHGGTPLNCTYSSNTSSTEEDSVVLNHVAPSGARENIPSVTVNRGTFRGGTKQSIMGNVLDSDKEDMEAMEGGDTVAQDKSEQTASSGAVNGESLAVDMKETVVLNEDGSELVVNGGSTEGGPDDSLDTETQTKEDEFPPDDLIGGEMAQPKQNGTMESKDETRPDEVQEVVNGRDLPSENPLGVEENGLEESSRGGEEESPEGVEAVSTLDTVQGPPHNVDHVVHVDHHHHPHVKEPTTTSGVTSDTGSGPNVCTEHDQSVGHVGVVDISPLEPCTEQTTQATTLNDNAEIITDTTNITPEQQTDTADTCNNDSDTYAPNISKGHEGLNELSDSQDLIPIEQSFSGENSDQVIVSPELETEDSVGHTVTDTTDKGSVPDTECLQDELEEALSPKQNGKQSVVEVEGSVESQLESEPSAPQEEMSLAQADIGELSSRERAIIDSKVDAIFGVETEQIQPSEEPLSETGTEEVQEVLNSNKEGQEPISVPEGQEVLNSAVDTGPDGHFVEGNISVESELNLESGNPANVETDLNGNFSSELEDQVSEEERASVVSYVDDVVSKAVEEFVSSNPSQNGIQESEAVVGSGEKIESAGVVHVDDNGQGLAEADQCNGLETDIIATQGEESLEHKPQGIADPDLESVNSIAAVSNMESHEGGVDLDVKSQDQSVEVDILQKKSFDIQTDPVPDPSMQPLSVKTDFTIPQASQNPPITEGSGEIPELSETLNKRWSAPVNPSTDVGFGRSPPESEDSGAPKFRPVKFRPGASASKDAKWRRTSLGVPRGWKAPPVDILPPPELQVHEESSHPPSLTEQGPPAPVVPTPEQEPPVPFVPTPEQEPPVPIVLTVTPGDDSDGPLSPGSSVVSSMSSASLESSGDGRDKNIYRAEPVMVTEEVGEPALSPVSYSTDISDTSSHQSPQTLDLSHGSPESSVPLSSPITEGTVAYHSPISPVTTPETNTTRSRKHTPPVSQKVPVYEMKEPPTSPPGEASSRREAFGQSRAMTTGDLPMKLTKAEEERQQVFAALRVKRPIKSKWQGQIELEEKEKESHVVSQPGREGMKSIDSAHKYEERKKKQEFKSKSFDLSSSSELQARPIPLGEGSDGSSVEGSRPHSLTIDASQEGGVSSELEIPPRYSPSEVLSPNGDTCSSGYTSGRSTPAGEDATRNFSLPKSTSPGYSMYKEYQSLLKEGDNSADQQSGPINEETGLRSINSGDSYVKSAVKLREKKGSKVNSHVVKQSRVSFVEQELIRQKQQEEEFRREREQRTQDIQHHGKAPVPPPAARVKSPTAPQPPAAKAAPAKPIKPANSKAKAIYQELNYNPKTGGNRSTAMAKDWENKFEK